MVDDRYSPADSAYHYTFFEGDIHHTEIHPPKGTMENELRLKTPYLINKDLQEYGRYSPTRPYIGMCLSHHCCLEHL